MIVDYTKNPNEVQSIIIYKKDLANNEKDELVE